MGKLICKKLRHNRAQRNAYCMYFVNFLMLQDGADPVGHFHKAILLRAGHRPAMTQNINCQDVVAVLKSFKLLSVNPMVNKSRVDKKQPLGIFVAMRVVSDGVVF